MSISSKTDIANLALDLISAEPVQNIAEPSNGTEELLNRWYDITRQKILRAHSWNFATKRAILAASSTDPEFGEYSAFPIPSDFIRLLGVRTSEDEEFSPYDFDIEFVGTQRCILASPDNTSLRIRYIYDVEDVSKFDPMFTDLFAHELALVVAYKGTESNGNVERIKSIADEAKRIAKAVDGQEKPPVLVRRSRNMAARRNFAGRSTHRVTFE